MGQGAAVKRRDFLIAGSLPFALGGCSKPLPIDGGFVGAAAERGHLLRSLKAPLVPSKVMRTRVLIAGGGVAGLAAARALRLGGMNDFALLELEDSAGGNSRTGEVNGIACPLGAHYLPVPDASNADARHVQDLLEELGVRRRVAGRWEYDEKVLCHSPQERLFINGQWQDGLLPVQNADAAALAQYATFARLVAQASNTSQFVVPVSNRVLTPDKRALDAITFEQWLNQNQLTSAPLRWYLDYCCRDDYGAGLGVVSAWAGIHYFASRHGFSIPGSEPSQGRDSGVLTWPQGNGWLTQRLAEPLGSALHTGRVVTRIAHLKHGVEVDALDVASGQLERWMCDHCIVALPLFVAARVIENPPPALQRVASEACYAPWLVANIHINAALHDRPGAAPSWDNVLYSDQSTQPIEGLGYVDASHQNLSRVPGATVLTHYRAFGVDAARRKHLYEQPWAHWRDTVLGELSAAHPDLPGKATRIDIMRYGHAMSVPVPGIGASAALQALRQPQATHPRLRFAHSDLSGYSVFEEAFTHGHVQGSAVARV